MTEMGATGRRIIMTGAARALSSFVTCSGILQQTFQ